MLLPELGAHAPPGPLSNQIGEGKINNNSHNTIKKTVMVADSGWVRGINTPSLRVIKKKKKKKKNSELKYNILGAKIH